MENRWIWPFELEEQIGAGAMGVVYRARYVKNDKRVALKLLPADMAADSTLAARFQREMEVLKDLRHPNIVHCFGGACEGKQWFYAMELVDGGTVEKLIRDEGRLRWQKVIDFALQACSGLEYAHSRGIIHRDIKPGNLLLTRAGQIKLSDFGLAMVAAETKLTAAGKTVGSLPYMAPEQIHGKLPMSAQTDLYALGCTLYEMVSGKPPFSGSSMAELLQRHLKDAPMPLSEVVLDCPESLSRIVLKLLAKNPADRPVSAEAVGQELKALESGIVVKPPRGSGRLPLPGGSRRPPSAATTPREEEVVGRSAAGPFAWLGWGIAVALLIWHLTSENSASPDAPMRDALIAGVKSEQGETRRFATQCLGAAKQGDAATERVLVTLLDDQDPAVRAEAARALGNTAQTSDGLLLTLRRVSNTDDVQPVRNAAHEAIEVLKARPRRSSLRYFVMALGVAFVALAVWLMPRIGRRILAQAPQRTSAGTGDD